MPERHESEDGKKVGHGFDLASRVTAHGDVNVPHDPAVETAVPAAPEGEGAVAVGDAAHHVLWRIDAVDECPEAEEAPWYQQFQPDDVKIEVA